MTNTQYLRSLLELAREAQLTHLDRCGHGRWALDDRLDIEIALDRLGVLNTETTDYLYAMSPDRLIPALEEALQAMEARPDGLLACVRDGWTLDVLEYRRHSGGFRVRISSVDRVRFGQGSTPEAAARSASEGVEL